MQTCVFRLQEQSGGIIMKKMITAALLLCAAFGVIAFILSLSGPVGSKDSE